MFVFLDQLNVCAASVICVCNGKSKFLNCFWSDSLQCISRTQNAPITYVIFFIMSHIRLSENLFVSHETLQTFEGESHRVAFTNICKTNESVVRSAAIIYGTTAITEERSATSG